MDTVRVFIEFLFELGHQLVFCLLMLVALLAAVYHVSRLLVAEGRRFRTILGSRRRGKPRRPHGSTAAGPTNARRSTATPVGPRRSPAGGRKSAEAR
jgi:hypothetical protein